MPGNIPGARPPTSTDGRVAVADPIKFSLPNGAHHRFSKDFPGFFVILAVFKRKFRGNWIQIDVNAVRIGSQIFIMR